MKPGELVDVTWADITEDARGEPDKLTPEVMTHTWRFHSWKTFDLQGTRLKFGVFTSGKPNKEGEYYHAVVIPKAVILDVQKARR